MLSDSLWTVEFPLRFLYRLSLGNYVVGPHGPAGAFFRCHFPLNSYMLPTCCQANLLKSQWVLPYLIGSSFWIYFIIGELVNPAPFGKYSCHFPSEAFCHLFSSYCMFVYLYCLVLCILIFPWRSWVCCFYTAVFHKEQMTASKSVQAKSRNYLSLLNR